MLYRVCVDAADECVITPDWNDAKQQFYKFIREYPNDIVDWERINDPSASMHMRTPRNPAIGRVTDNLKMYRLTIMLRDGSRLAIMRPFRTFSLAYDYAVMCYWRKGYGNAAAWWVKPI